MQFRAIPKSVSEPIWKTFFILFDDDRLEINPTQSDSFWLNQNKSEPSLALNQSELEFIQIKKYIFGLIQAWIGSDWKPGSDSFGLMPGIEVEWIVLSQIDFLPFIIKRDEKLFSDWFGTNFGIALNSSDWIRLNPIHSG